MDLVRRVRYHGVVTHNGSGVWTEESRDGGQCEAFPRARRSKERSYSRGNVAVCAHGEVPSSDLAIQRESRQHCVGHDRLVDNCVTARRTTTAIPASTREPVLAVEVSPD